MLLLLTLGVAGDRALALGLERLVMSSQFRFSRLYAGSLQADVLFVGNSRAVNTFYVPLINERSDVRTVNLGFNGMSAVLAEALVRDYLDRNPAPDHVVIEASFLGSDHSLLNELRIYRHRSERLRALLDEVSPRDARVMQLSHLFAFNAEMLYRSMYYLRRSDQDWINSHALSAEALAQLEQRPPMELELRADNQAALQRLVSELRSRGVRVHVVVAPYLPAYARRVTNLDDWMAEVAGVLPEGVPLVDYSRALTSNQMFADEVHTNHRGVEVLTERMLEDGVVP